MIMRNETFVEEFFDDYKFFNYISYDNTMLIGLNQAGYDNDLNHYKIGKIFETGKELEKFPPLDYNEKGDNFSMSSFDFEKIDKAIDFFNEYATKNHIKIKDIVCFDNYNSPIAFICRYYDKNPQRIESKILFVIANMIE